MTRSSRPRPQFEKSAAKNEAPGQVTDYASASPGEQARMREIMEPITSNPDSFEAVIRYGHDPIARLFMASANLIRNGGTLSDEIRAACLDAREDICVHLGAAKEVLRRYDEEYIPEAGKAFTASKDPGDERYLKDLTRRREDFIDRVIVLEGSRAASHLALDENAPGTFINKKPAPPAL